MIPKLMHVFQKGQLFNILVNSKTLQMHLSTLSCCVQIQRIMLKLTANSASLLFQIPPIMNQTAEKKPPTSVKQSLKILIFIIFYPKIHIFVHSPDSFSPCSICNPITKNCHRSPNSSMTFFLNLNSRLSPHLPRSKFLLNASSKQARAAVKLTAESSSINSAMPSIIGYLRCHLAELNHA